MAIKFQLHLFGCSTQPDDSKEVVQTFRSIERCLRVYNLSKHLHKHIGIIKSGKEFPMPVPLIEMDHDDTYINKTNHCDLLFYTDVLKIKA